MLVTEQVYNELMKLKDGIEKYQKKKRRKVVAMKVFMPIQDEDGLYDAIDNQFFGLASTLMGRMIICRTVFKPGAEYPYEFMSDKEFNEFQKTDEWFKK